mgnify:CR=1 FL=1
MAAEVDDLRQGLEMVDALVQGVDPAMEPKVSVVAEKMKKGRFDGLTQGSYNIILGQELATWLGVDVGEVLERSRN